MKTITNARQMQSVARTLRTEGKTIGFVPTMGYLHQGHLSLVALAKEKSNVVVLSIYVNPTQFGPNEDLDKYPRDFERDEALAKEAGVDYIFYPSDQEMYPGPYATYVSVEEMTTRLCGASRPNHFRGVTTICTKLFHIVQPHFAVFGQKDAQQVIVIQRMVHDLNFDMEIVIAPIVRESDGLAMSSRNSYLSPEERRDAVRLHQALQLAQRMISEGETQTSRLTEAMRSHISTSPHATIDYVEIVSLETLEPKEAVGPGTLIALAVYMGKTRLIDNLLIR